MTNGPKSKFHIRTKIWIENDDCDLLFGRGKTQILELIEQEGSISKAAELMGLNYKKAWSHIKTLQNNIKDDLVVTQKGGGGKGGTMLTPKAKEMSEKFKQLENEINEFADKRFEELFLPDFPVE